jgi:hypothetical protein
MSQQEKVCVFTRDVKGNWSEPDWVECPEWSLNYYWKSFQWRCATAWQHKSVQHKTPRWESAINSLKWWVCMCVLVFSALRNTLRVVEIIPLQLGRFPLQTISVNSHFSHRHTYPHRRVQTTQLLPLEVPAAGTSDTESGLKYRLSPRHPSPLLSPLQLESSPLFPSSCSMVFRILDIALPLSYHATWMAHSRTRFAWFLIRLACMPHQRGWLDITLLVQYFLLLVKMRPTQTDSQAPPAALTQPYGPTQVCNDGGEVR